MHTLTPRQRQVFEFVSESIAANGYPPTVREICAALGLSSPATVHAHLAKLEQYGLLERGGGKARTLTPAGMQGRPRPLPLVGRVAAGTPILAEQHIEEFIDIPGLLRRDDGDFVLCVRGDSMVNAGIFHGDYLVVHPQPHAHDGEIVVALVGEEATTKRFYRDGALIRLQPENDLYEPLVLEPSDVQLVGKVVGVFRQL